MISLLECSGCADLVLEVPETGNDVAYDVMMSDPYSLRRKESLGQFSIVVKIKLD